MSLLHKQLTPVINQVAELSSYKNNQPLVSNIIDIWDRLLPKNIDFSINNNHIEIPQNKDTSYHISIIKFLKCGEQMLALQKCKNFDEQVKPFGNNRQQFNATVFELKCAYFMHHTYGATIEFSPPVKVKNNDKKPDFKLIHAKAGEIFCECKSLWSINRIERSKPLMLAKNIEIDLQTLKIPEHLRIEIFFEKLPRHFNRNLGKQLTAAIEKLIKNNVIGIKTSLNYSDSGDNIHIVCQRKNLPIFFKNATEYLARPETFKRENAQILILKKNNAAYTNYISPIKEALTQLPQDKNCVIFIEPIDNLAGKELGLRNLSKQNSNLLATVFMYPLSPLVYQNKLNIQTRNLDFLFT
jgi:hypothetical protein